MSGFVFRDHRIHYTDHLLLSEHKHLSVLLG